jgi:coenzyme F420-reducing hydrogenase alpha subunit
VRWTTSLPFPDDQQEFVSVSLQHPTQYPMNQGRIVSSAGLDIDSSDYPGHIRELQVPHSTAFHALLQDKPYLVGPLARINLNSELLPADLRRLLKAGGIVFPSQNMFHSIVARAAEVWIAIDEASHLLNNYSQPDNPAVSWETGAGNGIAATEAPRGLLWHEYQLDDRGRISNSRIIPPTSQNQARIEEDLKNSLGVFGLDQANDALRLHGEAVIRNYDPCISCATHFLKLDIQRN